MVGRLLSLWHGLFSGAMFVLGSVFAYFFIHFITRTKKVCKNQPPKGPRNRLQKSPLNHLDDLKGTFTQQDLASKVQTSWKEGTTACFNGKMVDFQAIFQVKVWKPSCNFFDVSGARLACFTRSEGRFLGRIPHQ